MLTSQTLSSSGDWPPTLPLMPAHSQIPVSAPTGTSTAELRARSEQHSPSRACTAPAALTESPRQAPWDSMCIWILSKICYRYLQLLQTATLLPARRSKGTCTPAPISERSRSLGLCPCKLTRKRSSWDPAQQKQTLISAEPSPLPRGKVMFPAWKGASPSGALASSGDRGCRLVHREVE